MSAMIRQFGSSAVVTIPKFFLEQLNLNIGDQIEISADQEAIKIKANQEPRKGWFDNICEEDLKREAELKYLNSLECLEVFG